MLKYITPSISVYRTKFTGNLIGLQNNVIPKLEEKIFVDSYTKDNLVINGNISFAVDGPLGVCEGAHLDRWTEFSELLDFLQPHLDAYAAHLNLLPTDIKITSMWANKYPQSAYIKKHTHVVYHNLHSVVFYMKKPANSGELFIKDTDTDDAYEVPSEEGELVIFPSNLVHWTSPNDNTENKYTVGIDLYCSNQPIEYNTELLGTSLFCGRDPVDNVDMDAILTSIQNNTPTY